MWAVVLAFAIAFALVLVVCGLYFVHLTYKGED